MLITDKTHYIIAMLKEQEAVNTYLILPLLYNSVINHNQFTFIPEPVYLHTLPSNYMI